MIANHGRLEETIADHGRLEEMIADHGSPEETMTADKLQWFDWVV